MGKVVDLIGATVIRALLLLLLFGAKLIAGSPFLVSPFLHPGEFGRQNKYWLKLAWVSGDEEASWAVDLKMENQSDWRTMAIPTRRATATLEKTANSVYQTNLELDRPDIFFKYRVRREGQVVFEAQARSPVGLGKPQRVLMVGGITSPSASIARSIAFQNADLFIASDKVVDSNIELGRRFFDVFNADRPYPGLGGPCLRSSVWITPFLNSQIHGYQNGSYSFDTGDVHWVVLNSIAEPDIQHTQLWLENDLATARKDAWKIIVIHDAPVHSGKEEQLADNKNSLGLPLMEKLGVDMVLSGGVHNYQRTMPVSFRASQFMQYEPPSFTLDKDWNGTTHTKAKGTIYVVSGAGSDLLTDQDRDDAPETWRLYSTVFKSNRQSYSLLEIDGRWLQFSQLDSSGRVLDQFVLTR